MQRVDEYLKQAKQFRALANDTAGSERAQFARIAEEWERLAKHRLREIQLRIDRTAGPTPGPDSPLPNKS